MKKRGFTLILMAGLCIPQVYSEGLETPEVPIVLAKSTEPVDVTPVGSSTVQKRRSNKLEANAAAAANLHQAQVISQDSNQGGAKKSVIRKLVLNLRSGVNEIIPVSVGHSNRLITPFSNPKIITTATDGEAKFNTHNNIIYVAPAVEQPISFYLRNGDSEEQVISITLNPKKIPPIQATLKLAGYDPESMIYGDEKKAKKWERSSNYEDSVSQILKDIALQRIPSGYSMKRFSRKDPNPHCYQSGIQYSFYNGQVMKGHSFTVIVGVAANKTKATLEIMENACSHRDLVATTAYPRVALAPGQKTEFYIILRNQKRKPRNYRPSLIDLDSEY